jgi:DNA primase
MPGDGQLRLKLISHGYGDAEIASSGVLADSRWQGRIVGAWRDEQSRVTTLWARTVEAADDDRYLYLRGAPRAATFPYFLSGAPGGRSGNRADLVLVEGVLDVHILRAHGVEGVAALGGAATSERLFEQLADRGIQNATLALDNDPAGRAATIRAIERATSASRSPHIWVVDPDLLDAKDPGELVQRRGIEAWAQASAAPICGITWRALELTGPLTATTTERERRSALADSGAWLATLDPRHAIEQSNALDTVADTLDYDVSAVQRAFRDRHWALARATEPPRRGLDR